MTGFTPFRKFLMSICCASLIIIYVPVACLVGNEKSDNTGMALAETELFTEEETIELIEIESLSMQENV